MHYDDVNVAIAQLLLNQGILTHVLQRRQRLPGAILNIFDLSSRFLP